jgi:hypothetical protein
MTDPDEPDPDHEKLTPEDLAECKRWLEQRFGSVESANWYYDEWEAESLDEDQADYKNGWPPKA